MNDLIERNSGKQWVGPLSNLLFRAFRNSNETFEEIVDDFLLSFNDKSTKSISNEINLFHQLENQVFQEVDSPINRSMVDIIAERETAAISKSPFDPKFRIFLDGIYHHFLGKWLEHFTINKKRFQIFIFYAKASIL